MSVSHTTQTNTQTIITLIDQALQHNHKQEPKRHYLGASALGETCSRKIQYQYWHTPQDQEKKPSGQTLRIFQRGHQMETMMQQWLMAAGFQFKENDNNNGTAIGFSAVEGQLKGHVDGVIISGPDSLESNHLQYPMLWECKALKNSSWKDLNKKGLAISKPIYAAQVALYQAYCDLYQHPALFTAINADTMELYIELFPFDTQLAQSISDKAVNIIRACQAQEVLPRIARDPNYYACKFCSYQQTCWSDQG